MCYAFIRKIIYACCYEKSIPTTRFISASLAHALVASISFYYAKSKNIFMYVHVVGFKIFIIFSNIELACNKKDAFLAFFRVHKVVKDLNSNWHKKMKFVNRIYYSNI